MGFLLFIAFGHILRHLLPVRYEMSQETCSYKFCEFSALCLGLFYNNLVCKLSYLT